MKRCERCGATTDHLVRLTRPADHVEDDYWCRPCAEFDPATPTLEPAA